jgi:RNase P/RNase MRP subunit POP5
MFTAMILFAAVVGATDEKMDQVAADFRSLSRIAALASNLNDSRQVMLAMVDNDLENLRERRPDETYRWASLQRLEASRVKDQKSIERVQTEKELREVTLSAPNAYRVEVSVPTKQSLMSKNNRVYIRNVIVDSTGFDGKTTHQEIAVNEWVNPGDAHGVPLPEIGKSVKAIVELGVESGDKHAVADVALLQAKLTDDPMSPYFPAAQRLLKIREVLTAKDLNRGMLKTTVDEALLSLPGEMEKRTAEMSSLAGRRRQSTGVIAAGDASPDVLAALQQISHLLGGTLQEQTEARAKLQTIIDSLQEKPAQE